MVRGGCVEVLHCLHLQGAETGVVDTEGVLCPDLSTGLDIVYGLGPELRQEELDVKAKMIQARKTEHPGARSSAMQRLGYELHLTRVKLKLQDIRPHIKLPKARKSVKPVRHQLSPLNDS